MFRASLLVLLFIFMFEVSYAGNFNDDVKIPNDSCLDALLAKELNREEFTQIIETLEISEPLRTDLIDKITKFTESQNEFTVILQPILNGTAKITRSNLQGHLLKKLASAWKSLSSFSEK